MSMYGYKSLIEKDKLSREEILKFWENPIDKFEKESNQPTNYLRGEKRSKFLTGLIKEYLPLDSRILEIGCNVGRNLKYLYDAGYINLNGIEINKEAIDLMKITYPVMFKNIVVTNSLVEGIIPDISDNSYDLIFTMAVLEHIHYDSEFILSDIARVAMKYIITVEDEKTAWSNRHFPRNYKEVFENDVWKQVYEVNCKEIDIFDDRYWVRVFCKG